MLGTEGEERRTRTREGMKAEAREERSRKETVNGGKPQKRNGEEEQGSKAFFIRHNL